MYVSQTPFAARLLGAIKFPSVRFRWNLEGGSEVEAIFVMHRFFLLGSPGMEAFGLAEAVSAEMLTGAILIKILTKYFA